MSLLNHYRWLYRVMTLMVAVLGAWATASFNVYSFEERAQEQQFQKIIKDLRCPKCQNNNLHDSNAPLAVDIKDYVYDSLQTGQGEAQIVEFLVDKYGEFIIYSPQRPVLWLLPWVVAGGLFLWALINISYKRNQQRKRQADAASASMREIIADYEHEHEPEHEPEHEREREQSSKRQP
ncbi:cytochrome c-type biogenesis protein [Ostreibacterium oceani]|uniref:Cytochrome c-type biogenesis protein n=1 Tax=Ostreibacterium oceani TaxID=2654998 RepID=A0A6N7EVV1_9GAMM|nr:cytochrome c-type biogenesis protein [Ostreibacterium oceani]MPV86023.1 hypothetical protein [Ostreibacterium oceani]